MNRDIVQGGWKQFKGKAQVRWSMFTGDPLGVITGRRTQLAGERQSAYGAIHSGTLRGVTRIHPPAHPASLNRAAVGNRPRTASILAIHRHESH